MMMYRYVPTLNAMLYAVHTCTLFCIPAFLYPLLHAGSGSWHLVFSCGNVIPDEVISFQIQVRALLTLCLRHATECINASIALQRSSCITLQPLIHQLMLGDYLVTRRSRYEKVGVEVWLALRFLPAIYLERDIQCSSTVARLTVQHIQDTFSVFEALVPGWLSRREELVPELLAA
jgi:hypothetical protein